MATTTPILPSNNLHQTTFESVARATVFQQPMESRKRGKEWGAWLAAKPDGSGLIFALEMNQRLDQPTTPTIDLNEPRAIGIAPTN